MNDKYIDIDFAKLDIERQKRRGCSEAVFCECKTDEQLVKIFTEFYNRNQNVIGTRAAKGQFEVLKKVFPQIEYNEQGRVVTLVKNQIEKTGEIAICTGGTGDIPVAEKQPLLQNFTGVMSKNIMTSVLQVFTDYLIKLMKSDRQM